MGYGGWLIYSAAVENAKKAYPNKKIIVIYPKSLRSLFSNKKPDAEVIFENNPNVFKLFSSIEWKFLKFKYASEKYLALDFGDKKFHHHEYDTKERISYKKGKHAIEFACESLQIKHPELQPRIYLNDEEKNKVQSVLNTNGLKNKKFICIEPGTKTEFTPNKAWPEEYWSELYELIDKHLKMSNSDIQIVQIGSPNTPRLKNCVYLNGQFSFRETSYVLAQSIYFIGYVGGLTHLARAAGCKNIVVKSAWEPKELTSYPGDVEFYTDIPCKHCGLKTPCPIKIKCMVDITPQELFNKSVIFLKE